MVRCYSRAVELNVRRGDDSANRNCCSGRFGSRSHQAERHVLEAISVEELAGQQRVIEQERSLMYHI